MRPVSANSTGIPVYHSYTNTGIELQNKTIEDLMPDTLYEVVIASESHVGMGRFSVNHLLVLTTSFGKFIQCLQLHINLYTASMFHCIDIKYK